MGKMLKALEKAGRLRNNGYAIVMPAGGVRGTAYAADPAHGNGAAKFDTKIAGVCAVVFMVGLMSLLVSFKAVAELQKTKRVTTLLAQNIGGQKENIQHLEQLVGAAAHGREAELEQMAAELSDLEINYNLLNISVEDLKLSDRLLLEKYIALNEQVKKIEDGR